jgi:hypothetical protein
MPMFSFVEPPLAELILGSVPGLAAEAILVVSVAGLVAGIGAALFSRSSRARRYRHGRALPAAA